MRTTLLIIPALVISALLVACRENPVEPVRDVVVTAPAFDFSNGPAEPGNSYIVRGEFGSFAFFVIDPVTELGALITDDAACIDFEEVTLIPFQTIFSPAGEELWVYHEGGWVNAAILEPPYGCGDVVATGLVHNKWHDNDVFAFLYEHNRSNSLGGGANGRVGDYSVSWNVHLVWGGLTKDDFELKFNEKIIVK